MNGKDEIRHVAIACQGGGSHTAFTAGVLKRLLADPRTDIRALSGTSGGAVCAVLAWSGLVGSEPGSPHSEGVARLQEFWDDNTTPSWQVWLEAATLAAMRMEGEWGVTPDFSAYHNPFEAHAQFIELVERHVPFAELTPDRLTPRDPRLLISAADVLTGEFRVFRSHLLNGYAADRISSRMILASAALPTVFRAVPLCGGLYWDGGFTQNPPIRELIPAARRDRPDTPAHPGLEPVELWIIQVNPETRAHEPTSMADIRDRRNELTENISFQQEVSAIGHMNHLLAQNLLTDEGKARYGPVKIRVISMAQEIAEALDYESKMERNPAFIAKLVKHGEDRAADFLKRLDADAADERTALPSRNIWGRWTKLYPPCLAGT